MQDFKNCKKTFYDELVLYVHPDVYEPAEDSFALAKHIPALAEGDVLDVGTGSGLLALVAKSEDSDVTGIDVSEVAVENAKFNASQNGLDCKFMVSDLFSNVEGEYDLVIFNPPYLPSAQGEAVKGELDKAWNGGENGREVIDRFLDNFQFFLRPEGSLLTLASSLSGIDQTLARLRKHGFEPKVVEEVKMFHEALSIIVAKRG
ncbi:MAG: HemK2/MTQ2 family protein methyltransferase [Candidatus Micrarchaeia archaeon]|jgi:release factor glutamine methyltransferase